MDLSVIIVNWNSAEDARKCLTTVYANTRGLEFEVVVIDNASHDRCGEMLREHFPQARFLQSEANVGFAKANNLASQQASGRNILFLNPDTEVVGPAIADMAAVLDARPDAAIVGPRLLNSDGSIQTSCIRAFPTILNESLDADWLQRIFPRWSLWGMRPLFDPVPKVTKVDVVSGASLMIKRSAFEQVGMFTTSYFMYAEDVDLCFKVRQAGWNTYFVGSATVIHHGGQSSNKQEKKNFAAIAMREAKLQYFVLRRGRTYAVTYRVTTACVAFARLMLLIAALVLTAGSVRRHAIGSALSKWVAILRWCVGTTSKVRLKSQEVGI